MLYENRHVLSPAVRFADALILPGTAWTLWKLGVPAEGWEDFGWKAISLYGTSLFIGFLFFARPFRVYQGIRTRRLGRQIGALALCALLALGLGSLATALDRTGLNTQTHLAVASVGVAVLFAFRLTLIGFLRYLRRRGRNTQAWLVVGDNPRTDDILRNLARNPHYGIRVVGILDADAPSNGSNGNGHAKGNDNGNGHENGNGHPRVTLVAVGGPPRLGGLDCLPSVLAHQTIDEVILTLPLRSFYDETQRVIRTCAEAGIPVRLPSPLFEGAPLKLKLVEVGDLSLMTYFNGPSAGTALAVKRVVDLIGSTVGLVLLSPLFAGIALAIRITCGRPVIFRQERVGVNGRRFWLYKFRTMVLDAEDRKETLLQQNEAKGPVFKMRVDPRVTPVGRILRKFHLDELPQLWNVFRGDMSLVGPRPPVQKEVDQYEWWQRRRLSFPPGITGLWQVEGSHDLPFSRWVELDLEYIDRWSLMLDFRLLAGTLPKVFRGKGL